MDEQERATLIEKGYTSPLDIANTPKRDFIKTVDEDFVNPERLHNRAVQHMQRTISGHVFSAEDRNESISNAKIRFKPQDNGTAQTVTSDPNGSYSVDLLPSGYQVQINVDGYHTETVLLTVQADSGNTTANFFLEPKNEAVPEGVTLTLKPRGGLSIPGVSSLGDITGGVGASLDGGQSVLTWGGSIAFGSRDGFAGFRLTGLYRCGTIITTLQNDEFRETKINESFTAFTADVVLRPIPRIFVEPYVIGGFGFRKITHGNSDMFQMDSRWKPAAQIGAGVDIPIGTHGFALGLEAITYISEFSGEGGLKHDVFGTARIPLF